MKISYLLCYVGVVAALPEPPISFDETKYDSSSIITRDVCIIGGGSSGTYTAIGLRDLGKSVVVIEREAILGGQTNTYSVPGTDVKIDYGVLAFHNTSIVHDYFNRFNIPLVNLKFGLGMTQYIDFQTGLTVPKYTPPIPSSLPIYSAQLAKYPYIEDGFDLQYPVPSDLLLPFGDFVKKYALENMVSLVFQFTQGLGDLLYQPTLYVFKLFGPTLINDIKNNFVMTARHDNHEIYDKALAELGEDALISSQVLAVDRPSNCSSVKVVVLTPSGVKLIKASKLLITIPPKLYNLQAFDLDNTEQELFGQFGNSAYYTALVNNTGLPDNTTYINIGTEDPYDLAHLPGLYNISPTEVPGIFDVKYGSADDISTAEVKADILATIARLKNAGLPVTNQTQFVAFENHVPFGLTVPTEAIAGGFYENLTSLQGRRSTWWTGAAFDAQDSALLWSFVKIHVLPALVD